MENLLVFSKTSSQAVAEEIGKNAFPTIVAATTAAIFGTIYFLVIELIKHGNRSSKVNRIIRELNAVSVKMKYDKGSKQLLFTNQADIPDHLRKEIEKERALLISYLKSVQARKEKEARDNRLAAIRNRSQLRKRRDETTRDF